MTTTQRRKVALVHWRFAPTTGGVESYLLDLVSALRDLETDVTVITGEANPHRPTSCEVISTSLLDPSPARHDRTNHLQEFLGAVLEQRGVDVVHAHNLHHFSPDPALALDALRRTMGFRLHHTFHEAWPDVLHSTPVYARWDATTAVSSFVAEECGRLIGHTPRVLHLGVDTERFCCESPSSGQAQTQTLLHPARLLPWKGIETSIEVVGRLRRAGRDVRLVITDTSLVADSPREIRSYRSSLERRVQALGIRDSVEFVEASFAEMPLLYARSNIVLYPTASAEPLGLSPLEAMSCRRPVVASRRGGVLETVIEGETGFLCEPSDVAAFTDRVARLLDEPSLGRRMGEAGRARVIERFSLSQHVTRLLELYDELPAAQAAS